MKINQSFSPNHQFVAGGTVELLIDYWHMGPLYPCLFARLTDAMFLLHNPPVDLHVPLCLRTRILCSMAAQLRNFLPHPRDFVLVLVFGCFQMFSPSLSL